MYNKSDLLLQKAQNSSIALSLFNIDMICKQLGYAYYDVNIANAIVLVYVNPKKFYTKTHIEGGSLQMSYIASEIILVQNKKYSLVKDRFEYDLFFNCQQDYIDYIKRCHNHTMNIYKRDGIL